MTHAYVELQTPFADSSVAMLRFHAAAGTAARRDLPTVAGRTSEAHGTRLVAEVLGCSHRVEVVDLATGASRVEEVLACEPSLPSERPAEARLDGYDFVSHVVVVAAAADWSGELDSIVAALESGHDESLVTRFPDARGSAVTALGWSHAAGGAAQWQTVHAYPGERRIVVTASRIATTAEFAPAASTGRSASTAVPLLARAVLLVLVALLLAGCGLSANPKSYVSSKYARAKTTTEFEQGSTVYVSRKSPAVVARDIIKHRKPASKRLTPGGWYLRYSKWIIAVLPGTAGGSRIVVDNQRNGYLRHYGSVGGWWGTSSGRAENFRGGGPGVGK